MIKFNFYVLVYFSFTLLLLSSCNNQANNGNTSIDSKLELEDTIAFLEFTSQEDIIFYNIFSPIDGAKIWKGGSLYYNSKLINQLNNITRYQSSDKIALNLGIYGTDLSYLWMFKQNQQGLSYLSAVQRLSAQLGIPNEFIKLTAEAAENNVHETDSLLNLARNAYSYMDEHLKNSDRAHTANLVLLGGWIESLYIATNLYDDPDAKLASKIATQKFSLYSLINLLENNQDDLVVKEYLLLLDNLKEAFNRFEIQFKPENIEIDTVSKRIAIKKDDLINMDPQHFKEIKTITNQIRKHIIS